MIRRSKIKARPIIKKSQTNVAKSQPQNQKQAEPGQVCTQPENDHQKVIKTVDDSPVLSTSNLTEKCQPDINETTVTKEIVSNCHPVCKPQHDEVITSSSHELPALADNHPVSQLDEISTASESHSNDSCKEIETSGKRDSNLHVNMPSVGEVNLRQSPLDAAVTQTTITTMDAVPSAGQTITEYRNVIESKKSTIPGGRRRKIMACPTAGKKRRKINAKSEGTKLNKNASASVLSNDSQLVSATPDSKTSMAISLPNNVESTDAMSLNPEPCTLPLESSEEVVLTDVAALTTITTISEVTPPPQIDDSLIFGINPSNDGIATEDTPTASTYYPISDSTIETSTPLVPHQPHPIELTNSDSVQQLQSPKIPHPKKCIVKIKSKSLSNKYRSKALEKLNHLKQKQSDGSEWPELDQNYVSMSDLIFLNPPAKVGHKLGMNADQEETVESVIEPTTASVETSETVEDSNDNNPLPVPQIRIAADGSVVVDEESLVLDTQKPQDPTVHTVYESGKDTAINQRSFMRRTYARRIRWSVEETNEFYRCLRIVGAEFSLMSAMFRGRNPDDLRRKFRREHKNNPVRVDQALMQQHLSKWTDDMFKANEPNSSSILKPPQETPTQS